MSTEEMPKTKRKRNGADLFVQSLIDADVEVVFGYPGGAVLPIYDALYRAKPNFKHIMCRHEQGLIHGAEGYARVTGKPGVVIATSGPGGTNLITGIADAMIDSLPIVIFTGQVSAAFIGSDAFQEADMIGLTTPITKHNYQVQDVHDLPRIIKEAFHIATTGRKGPVVIDLPKNVAETFLDTDEFDTDFYLPGYQPTVYPNQLQIQRLMNGLKVAERPLLLVGAGVKFAEAHKELYDFAVKHNIPVVTTLQGLGAFPETHPQALGMGGMHGSYAANKAIQACDFLINIGSRFDDRLTGNLSKFATQAVVAHIDVDSAEIGKNVPTKYPIVSDAKEALIKLLEIDIDQLDISDWEAETQTNKNDYPFWYQNKEDSISPQWLIEEIYHATEGKAVVVTDVGQHQMWAGQFYKYDQPHNFVTSGGLGTMGFGLPAALGAQIGRPGETVVAILGDGGIQMTSQELATIKDYDLPVKVVIVNNESLGMVRQWQEIIYEERYSESLLGGGRNPDFVLLAESYGIKGVRISQEAEVKAALRAAFDEDGPVVIDARVTPDEKVFPMVPAGKGNDEMMGVKPPCDE
ncbi:acetolactate synthase, large subunit, biosynthetic type [Jeotgalibaca sp. PTS2502]|uniref:biosynthetic-type acetolactate synthase large subunit n=1 Tax=Jeotgalibaca sp. PTS2502 TaxID=1903686 RepID=UPI0009737089|nr:biosynthetic-type acetolactate synthase large subunit [Jeotgalibaca sp. PTS2502]APZ48787.1 acetolactate synthase, large subunit, biosynthetic type [Jeotgalibaca sp. PTS2502]